MEACYHIKSLHSGGMQIVKAIRVEYHDYLGETASATSKTTTAARK